MYLGFDPGGAKGFGCCVLTPTSFLTTTVSTISQAFDWAYAQCGDETPVAAGIDTLLHWSDGPSGWRPADRFLKLAYPDAISSVMSPNSLFGAMAVGGVGLAIRLRQRWPGILLTETHPKVLFHALRGSRYANTDISAAFDWFVEMAKLSTAAVTNEHELDALISAWAAREGLLNGWRDLCEPQSEDMLFPAGPVSYFWPESVELKTTTVPGNDQPKKPSEIFSMSPEASARLHAEIDAAREAGMDLDDWRIKQKLDAKGLAWTRANYIEENWGPEPPDPEYWEEGMLPADLQDWEAGPPR